MHNITFYISILKDYVSLIILSNKFDLLLIFILLIGFLSLVDRKVVILTGKRWEREGEQVKDMTQGKTQT